jgi:Cu+-exporting ATPase
MVGTGKGAEKGVLIKGGEPLETLCKIDTIIFDKTGTITEGKPQITDIIVASSSQHAQRNANSLIQIAMALEAKSEHPLAEAIVRYATEKKV